MKKIDPLSAMLLGYDYKAMNDTEKVTIVRRRVIYEEVVMSKNELKELNKAVKKQEDELPLDELEMKDIQFPDFTDEQTEYVAFPGDVTSFTDDAISFLFKKQPWTDSYSPVRLAS